VKFFFSFFFFAFLSFAARADTDQLCLKQCVAGGLTSTACLAQCSYFTQESLKPVVNETLSPQRVLKAPVPVGKLIVLKNKAKTSPPAKDYGCFNSCLKSGKAYGLCEAACVKKECKPDEVLCARNKKK